jgi:hypothetical protein
VSAGISTAVTDRRYNASLRQTICLAKLSPVKSLTKQEQLFLVIVLGLLLTGWAVKTWRIAHPPPAAATQQAKP